MVSFMKRIITLCTLFVLICLNADAQHITRDKQKEKQWRSMEAGPWDFEPEWYYYFTHKKYSGAKQRWRWRAFKSGWVVSFDESRSNVKRIIPIRTAELLAQKEKVSKVETERLKVKELYDEDLYKQADRSTDLVYTSFKGDFNRMQDEITDGLAYCMTKSKGKLSYQVNELLKENEILCEGIAYIHKQGVGYELENAKRQKAYLEFKAKMKKILVRTANLVAVAQTHF